MPTQTTVIAITAVTSISATIAVHWLLTAPSGLAERAQALINQYLDPRTAQEAPVVRLAAPDELELIFERAGCPLAIREGDEPLDDDALIAACGLTMDYNTRSASNRFFNQLYGRADIASIVGDWVATAINASVYTYEVAPVLTLMEQSVLARIAHALGGGAWANSHDGLFLPGGSVGNMYSLHLARHRFAPQINTEGATAGPRLVGFTSEDAHYSYLKSTRLIGMGSNNLVSVRTGPGGGMCPEALREAITAARAAGGTPFFVGATAGTTVTGAFDPLRALAAVCAESEPPLYLHVDGAWGGATIFSPTHRYKLDGVELADSFSWSAHKMLGAPLQCVPFVTRHPKALRAANATNAAYLFQPDKLYAELDVGDKTLQCGRKADMMKLWMLMKARGDAGMAARVDHCYALAAHAADRIRNSDGAFKLAVECGKSSAPNVCFWYVPKKLRPLGEGVPAVNHPLHCVAPQIKEQMQQAGSALIGFQSIHGLPNFFRWVFASPDDVTFEIVDEVLDLIASLGDNVKLAA